LLKRTGRNLQRCVLRSDLAPLAMEEAVLVEEGDTVGQVEVVSAGIPHHDLLHAGSDLVRDHAHHSRGITAQENMWSMR